LWRDIVSRRSARARLGAREVRDRPRAHRPHQRRAARAGYYCRGSGSLDDLLTSPLGLAIEVGSVGVLDALIDTVNPFS
jgi:hypothetical protein